MKKHELLKLVTAIYEVDGSEEEIALMINSLREQLPHSKIVDLIFHDFRHLSPQQVVDEAMQREADYSQSVEVR